LSDARRLNADAMRAIRDLAMGLRPSMLDDLGLEAALQWQGREFSRHTGVPATVTVEGQLDHLTDPQQTGIYRVVQEALTNCARHAKAKNVIVSIRSEGDQVIVVVQDDGIGFDAKTSVRGGLGLIGIRERVEALDGKLHISSLPNHGTVVQAEVPIGVLA
jgi:signal transduction histidine kinase